MLQRTLLLELRETEVAQTRTQLAGKMAGGLDAVERTLAAELISPLIVPNSSFDQALTDSARDAAAAAVEPVRVSVAQGEIVIPNGEATRRRGHRDDRRARHRRERSGPRELRRAG